MKKNYSSISVGIFIRVSLVLMLAKVLMLSLLWFLPSMGASFSLKDNYKPSYQRVNFKNLLSIEDKKAVPKKVEVVESSSNSSGNIQNMILNGLYGTKTKGFAIVALKSSPKDAHIITIGEEFSGYILKYILSRSVVFERDSTEFTLELKIVDIKSSITKYKKPVKKLPNSSESSYSDEEVPRLVTRSDIAYYSKNPKEIWRDISIREVKEGREIKGFKVTKIKQGSKMQELGLQKGDLIVRANNIELKSYRDALKIYEKIDKITTIEIVVIRQNQEVELVYDIN